MVVIVLRMTINTAVMSSVFDVCMVKCSDDDDDVYVVFFGFTLICLKSNKQKVLNKYSKKGLVWEGMEGKGQ